MSKTMPLVRTLLLAPWISASQLLALPALANPSVQPFAGPQPMPPEPPSSIRVGFAPAPVVQPSPAAAPASAPPMRVELPPPRKRLMITGWAILGGSYLTTAFWAAEAHDRCDRRPEDARAECRAASSRMFVPVVGPMLAIPRSTSASETFGLVLSGASQGIGAVLALIGTFRFLQDRRRNQILRQYGIQIANGLHLGTAATADLAGGKIELRYRF